MVYLSVVEEVDGLRGVYGWSGRRLVGSIVKVVDGLRGW